MGTEARPGAEPAAEPGVASPSQVIQFSWLPPTPANLVVRPLSSSGFPWWSSCQGVGLALVMDIDAT